MPHYDPTLDQIITGMEGQTRENLMRVVTGQKIPYVPPSEEFPTGEIGHDLSIEAFRTYPMWGRKTQVPRVNKLLEGDDQMGALILVHVPASEYLDLWQAATIMQRPDGTQIIDAFWPDIAPEQDRVDEWKDDLEKSYEGNAVPIPTPVLQISSLGDLVTVPNGLARAAAILEINEEPGPNPANMVGELMPLYILARPVSGSRFDDFPDL